MVWRGRTTSTMFRLFVIIFHIICIHYDIFLLSNYRCFAMIAKDGSNTCNNNEDSSSCNEPADENNRQQEDSVSSPLDFMRAFSNLGSSWSHVLSEYKSVVQGADGYDLKDDIRAQNMNEGLALLQSMVQDAASVSEDDGLSWSFHTTPLSDFDKTIDDVLLSFLRWSVVDNNKSYQENKYCHLIGGVNEYDNEKQDINISKAFRRLTSYMHWMKSVEQDLVDPPLTFESISPSLSTFSLHVTHDSCNRIVWWVNLGKTDLAAFKSQSPKETTRLFVWIAHLLFLDQGAQQMGLVVVDDMSDIGFYDYMTMLPLQVGISVDRFLVSVTPLKAKNVVLMHLPRWAEIGWNLLSWFLTKKMKSRVTVVSSGDDDIDTLLKVVGGFEYIPVDFGNYKGELISDMVAEYRR